MSWLPIYTGGLSRCCLTRIREFNGPDREGVEVTCFECGEPLRVRRGAWELAQPIFPATAHNARVSTTDHGGEP